MIKGLKRNYINSNIFYKTDMVVNNSLMISVSHQNINILFKIILQAAAQKYKYSLKDFKYNVKKILMRNKYVSIIYFHSLKRKTIFVVALFDKHGFGDY